MNPLEDHIQALLRKYTGEFRSSNGVAVYLDTNGSVFLNGQLDVYCSKTLEVGICVEFDDVQALIEALRITSVSELKRLSISALVPLYRKGRAQTYCSMRYHGDFPLRFVKVDSVLIVIDDNDEVIDQYISTGTTEEVILYTYDYFSRNKHQHLSSKLHFEF